MTWTIYLSGEIHSDWRDQIIDGASKLDLPVKFTSAVTDHDASDAAGDMLGPQVSGYWRDHKSSKVNGIRTRVQLEKCDLAVVRERYLLVSLGREPDRVTDASQNAGHEPAPLHLADREPEIHRVSCRPGRVRLQVVDLPEESYRGA